MKIQIVFRRSINTEFVGPPNNLFMNVKFGEIENISKFYILKNRFVSVCGSTRFCIKSSHESLILLEISQVFVYSVKVGGHTKVCVIL